MSAEEIYNSLRETRELIRQTTEAYQDATDVVRRAEIALQAAQLLQREAADKLRSLQGRETILENDWIDARRRCRTAAGNLN